MPGWRPLQSDLNLNFKSITSKLTRHFGSASCVCELGWSAQSIFSCLKYYMHKQLLCQIIWEYASEGRVFFWVCCAAVVKLPVNCVLYVCVYFVCTSVCTFACVCVRVCMSTETVLFVRHAAC